jgi:two-component system, OmpR family, response regulator
VLGSAYSLGVVKDKDQGPEGPQRALVVEDSDELRRRLVDIVAKALSGFEVSEARSVSTAIESARRLQPGIVTLDLGLPDGSGLDVLRAIREGGAPARVIVVTGRSDEGYRRASLEAGADEFLDKADLARLPALLTDTNDD